MVNPPPPGYGPPPPGYYGPPPGYPGYPPPGYGPPPGYYGPPPGYFGPPPGYPQPELKPGVIPLRPLSLTELYNGAVGYIRANPKVVLGLTAIVVVTTQILNGFAQVGLFSALGPSHESTELTFGDVVPWLTAITGAGLVTALGTIVLTGMLTAVVGRAVFGSPITIGEAWAIVRTRFAALIGVAALFGVAAMLLLAVVVAAIVSAGATAGAGAAVLIGLPLMLGLIGALGFGYAALIFAPAVIVLERQPVFEAIRRSYALVRNSFWRVVGIMALTALIASVVSSAVAFPFDIFGMIFTHGADATSGLAQLSVFGRVGATIGQIIVLPFSAGVAVLLYTDRRIRAEAFDLVLRTGAMGGPYPGSTDGLWLTRR